MSTKTLFTNLKIPILSNIRFTIPLAWCSKLNLLSNFTPRMSRVGLVRMETPEKIKSLRGGYTVLNQLRTKASVLFGFSIMHQRLHHSRTIAISCKGKVFYGQKSCRGESAVTDCGVNYQLLAVSNEFLVAVDHNQLQTMTSETVDRSN